MCDRHRTTIGLEAAAVEKQTNSDAVSLDVGIPEDDATRVDGRFSSPKIRISAIPHGNVAAPINISASSTKMYSREIKNRVAVSSPTGLMESYFQP